MPSQIGQLRHLRALCVERDPYQVVEMRVLAMKSFTSIVKDIAPRFVMHDNKLFMRENLADIAVIISVNSLMLRRQ